MHIPVLTNELVDFLCPQPGRKYIDSTLGEGGHAENFLKKGAYLLGIELDPDLLEQAQERLAEYENKELVRGNYRHIGEIARQNEFDLVSGIYFDLGACLWHFKNSKKGFSFKEDEPLDMRYDPEGKGVTAAGILNDWPPVDIEKILKKYGEEKYAARIARAIKRRRQKSPFETSRDLVQLLSKVLPSDYDKGRIHPARRTFQALRIAVNKELDNLEKGLKEAEMLLQKEGRLAVISYHSLEDKIVKNFFKENPRVDSLTSKPVTASEREVKQNPAARSAKMRVVEKKL